MLLSPNCAKIKFVASSRNSVQEEMLPKNYQESRDIMSPSILLRKIQERLLGDHDHQRDHKMSRIQGPPQEIQRSKRSMLPNCQKIHVVWIAKGCEIAKGPRCQESKGSPKDPCYPSYQEIQVSKSSLEKSTLFEAEPFVAISFPCIVKGPSLEPINLTL